MDKSPIAARLFKQNLLLFNALGDAHRQNIILLLSRVQRLNVGELTRLTNLSRPAVSHHIKVLRRAGLIGEEKEGTRRYYYPTFGPHIASMRQLLGAIEKIETKLGKCK